MKNNLNIKKYIILPILLCFSLQITTKNIAFSKNFDDFFHIKPLIKTSKKDYNFQESELKIKQDKNCIEIQIQRSPYGNNITEASFELMKQYFKQDLIKISVLWQKDIHSYGKMYSIAGIYINEYLNEKLTDEKLISFFNEKDILPANFSKNGIKKTNFDKISDALLIKSAKLRDEAEVYRINKDYQVALRIYESAVKMNPTDYIAYFHIGTIQAILNNNKKACRSFEQALQIKPSFKAADNALYELKKISTYNEK